MTASATASSKQLSKKQLLHASSMHRTPFTHWPHPTPEEAQQVCDLLANVHGMPERPKILEDKPGAPAGCGNVPSVLDALVRTILSANTTSKNSTAAKVSMDEVYGRANYRAVLSGGPSKLEETIRCGGLAQNKSKAIVNILQRLEDRNVDQLGLEPGKGELSLDWLHQLSDDEAMNELISYDSVGIKTASCVLLFCLGRESFAVDTHVWRISQSLGWLPPNGSTYSQDSPPKKLKQTTNPPSRDQTFYHLDHLLPPHLKYPLHSLLVRHGRGCVRCAANGVTTQDFVETCPIDHLVRRKKGKYTTPTKKTSTKAVVKNEDGETVGHVSAPLKADDEEEGEKAEFEPLEDAPEERKAAIEASLGSRKRKAVKLEDEAGQPRDTIATEGSVSPSPSPSPTKSRSGRERASKKPKQEGVAQDGDAGGTRTRARRASAVAASTAIKDEADENSDLTDLGSDSGSEHEELPTQQQSKTKKKSPRQEATKKAALMKSSKPAATRARAGAKAPKAAAASISSVSRDEAEMGGQVYRGTMHGLDV
ncbi:hypothetical protein JCM10908_000767 [Rhodotorula pacifica]|uniref:endonuclease III domain-containing protein n=1 Tax=Rhodotorula pacifica TaxID=1495444 RepID=UPI00316E67E6